MAPERCSGATVFVLGASLVAGAASGAIAGGLSSTLIGGQFSWEAVGLGAVTGAISGGAGNLAGTNQALQIAAGGAAGGTTNWLGNAAQGHAGIHSFIDGAILGTVISAAEVGVQYLNSPSSQSAASDVSRSPASAFSDAGNGGGGASGPGGGVSLTGESGEPGVEDGIDVSPSENRSVSADSNVTFGHGDRHILDPATTQDEVENAIRSQVSPITNAGWFSSRVTVNGVIYTFRGYTTPAGDLNIGTYFPPRSGQ